MHLIRNLSFLEKELLVSHCFHISPVLNNLTFMQYLIFSAVVILKLLPSVLWCCWLCIRKSFRPVKIEWWGVGVVICLKRDADCLHIVQLMPLPPRAFQFAIWLDSLCESIRFVKKISLLLHWLSCSFSCLFIVSSLRQKIHHKSRNWKLYCVENRQKQLHDACYENYS